nr:unnamed protein product [Spirometra erinaceieuropaei]
MKRDLTELMRTAVVTADRCVDGVGFRQLTTLKVVPAAECSLDCAVSWPSAHNKSGLQSSRISPQCSSTNSLPCSTTADPSAFCNISRPICSRRQSALQSQLMTTPLFDGSKSQISQPAHAVGLLRVEGLLDDDVGELSALASYLSPSRGDVSLCRLKYLPSSHLERVSFENLPSLVQKSRLISVRSREAGSGERNIDPPPPHVSSPVEFELTSDKLIHYSSAVDVEALSIHISHPPNTSTAPVGILKSGQGSPETAHTSPLHSTHRASAELLPFRVKRQLFEQSAFASSSP